MTPAAVAKTNLFSFDRAGLEGWLVERGEAKFRAQQLMKWAYHQKQRAFSDMSNLSNALRESLAASAEFRLPEVRMDLESVDGTRKWLLGVDQRNAIETVFIPETNRGTLCVSSQVGCALNCTFCATGAQGFNRNLSAAEIVAQVWIAADALGHVTHKERRITNVVLMGMGEPLLNFDSVVTAMSVMQDDLGFGLAGKRVTLSTAGLVPGIEKLSDAADVSLAVSLHAPDNETRNRLVPLNKKYPIPVLLEACRKYLEKRPRARVTFEYTLIDGVNDSESQARSLVKLLRSIPSKLNLIPFNPFPGTQWRCSTPGNIRRFQQIVLDAGIVATLRRTRGQDIDAACGQLAGDFLDRTRRSAKAAEAQVA